MSICTPYKFSCGDVVKTNKTSWTVLGRKIIDTEPGTPKKYYLCRCHNCKACSWKSEQDLYQGSLGRYGNGLCGVCSNRVVLTGFNDVATTHPECVKFFKDPEDALHINAGSREKRRFKCPECGYEVEKGVEYVTSKNDMCCPQCSDNISYPNKLALSVLRQLNVENLIAELKESWSENKRYDFSFFKDGIHYLVEMDGGFHYEEKFGRTAKTIKETDILKSELASNNNCILIRIDCKKSNLNYIKENIEKSLLSELYDISIIDWKKVENDCKKSILVKIVDYKIKYPETTEQELAEIFNISRCTVVTYLKRANNIGLINYRTYTEKLQDRYIQVVEYKKQNVKASNQAIGEIFNISGSTVRNYLMRAEKEGIYVHKTETDLKKEILKEYFNAYPEKSSYKISIELKMSRDFVEKCRKELSYA